MPTNAPDKIPPGLELDALTAQRVFGWKNVHKHDGALVSKQELLVTTFATADALAKLLIGKGLITQERFSQKLAAERANLSETTQPHCALSMVSASR